MLLLLKANSLLITSIHSVMKSTDWHFKKILNNCPHFIAVKDLSIFIVISCLKLIDKFAAKKKKQQRLCGTSLGERAIVLCITSECCTMTIVHKPVAKIPIGERGIYGYTSKTYFTSLRMGQCITPSINSVWLHRQNDWSPFEEAAIYLACDWSRN